MDFDKQFCFQYVVSFGNQKCPLPALCFQDVLSFGYIVAFALSVDTESVRKPVLAVASMIPFAALARHGLSPSDPFCRAADQNKIDHNMVVNNVKRIILTFVRKLGDGSLSRVADDRAVGRRS
jgi:hypothetical protein